MSRRRIVVCCVLCALLDALCLAANGFRLDTGGALLLAASDFLIWFALSRSGRARHGKK